MKYIVFLGDGMADEHYEKLNGATPLEVAHKPYIDHLAQLGKCGLVKTVPDNLSPGSDVANLAVLGYDVESVYTGRAPLEALSIGVEMSDTDVAIRCNLVTLSDEENYADKSMLDYAAGDISTEEAHELIAAVNEALGDEKMKFYGGVSYRNCLIVADGAVQPLTAPHDISGKIIGEYLPADEIVKDIMIRSYEILKNHPINLNRIKIGKSPANSIWLWGAGTKSKITEFEKLHGLKGTMISAVDLLKGIAIGAKMTNINVENATGRLDTNWQGKIDACVKAIKDGADYVYLHMEAPDECGHQGDCKGKIKAIEMVDKVVFQVMRQLVDEEITVLICPDHPTPLAKRTHTKDAVPFIVYNPKNEKNDGTPCYTEANCRKTGIYYDSGASLMADIVSNKVGVKKAKNLVKDKKSLTPKQKKGLIISIIAAVLVLVIALSIAIPIVVINKDKVFVGKVEDFENFEDGKYYVLTNDVTVEGDLILPRAYSIDLAGYSLVVTGTLKYEYSEAEKIVHIGTQKGKSYNEKGLLQLGGLDVNSNGKLEVHSLINVNTLIMQGSNSLFHNGLQINKSMKLSGGKHHFEQSIGFAEGISVETLNSEITLDGEAKADFVMTGSKLYSHESTIVNSVTMDANSELRMRGKVQSAINGGKMVVMGKTSSAGVIKNVIELWIYPANSNYIIEVGETSIKNIIELVPPPTLIVTNTSDGRVVLQAKTVDNGVRYECNIDGGSSFAPNVVTDTVVEFDITDRIKTYVGEIRIAVRTLGAEGVDEELVVPSAYTIITYVHKIQIATPTNVVISDPSITDGKYILSYDAVKFANKYKIEINGKLIETTQTSIDLTSYLSKVGSYSIFVQAVNTENLAYENSDKVLTGLDIRKPFDKPTLSRVDGGAGANAIVLELSSTEAKMMEVTYTFANGSTHVVRMKTSTQITIAIGVEEGKVPSGTTVSVKFLGFGYNIDSEISDIYTLTV